MREAKMNSYKVIFSILIICLCFSTYFGDVIVRTPNTKEGSVCFLYDKRRGICKPNCIGQNRAEYKNDVCSSNGTTTLYCCLNNERAEAYPTLEKVCMDQRLDLEFLQRLKDKENEANTKRNQLYDEYDRHYESVVRDCYQQALELEEDERETFLSKCLTVPQKAFPPPDVVFRYVYTDRPFLVAFGFKYDNGVLWACTGTLIHESYLLTSENCIHFIPDLLNRTLDDGEGVARVVWYSEVNSSPVEFDVKKIFIYEENDENVRNPDMAIIQIERKSYDYDLRAIPICLWTQKELPTQHFKTAGFTKFSVEYVDEATYFKSNVMKVSSDKCKNLKFDRDAFEKNKMCMNATEVEIPEDSCYTNAGMPVYFVEEGWLKVPYLAGVVTLGKFCEQGNTGTVDSIYPYLNWIERIISGNH